MISTLISFTLSCLITLFSFDSFSPVSGLVIAKNVISLHGGVVIFETELGKSKTSEREREEVRVRRTERDRK